MKIQTKITWAILAIWAFLSLITYIGSTRILETGFARLEERQISANIARAEQAMDQLITATNNMNKNLAVWDDSYTFMQDKDESYIKSNWLPATFTAVNLDLVLYYDGEGKPFFTRAVDLDHTKEIAVPEGLSKHLDPNGKLVHQSNEKSTVFGWLLLPSGVLQIASHSILKSDGSGSSNGALIVGKFFTEESLKKAEQVSKLELALHRLDQIEQEPTLRSINELLQKQENPLIEKQEKTMKGYNFLKNIHGEPIAILQIDMNRDIYQLGLDTINYYTRIFLLTGLAFTLLLIYLIHKLVIQRLKKLNNQIVEVGNTKEFSLRVSEEGTDELGSLAAETNKMFMAVEEYDLNQKKLMDQVMDNENFLENILNSFTSLLVIANRDMKIIHINKTAEIAFNTTAQEAKEKLISNYFEFPVGYEDDFSTSLKMQKTTAFKRVEKSIDNVNHFYDILFYPVTKVNDHAVAIRIDDITYQVNSEEMLSRNNKLASVGAIMEGIVYKVTTPLNCILDSIQPLKSILNSIYASLKQYRKIKSQKKISQEKLDELKMHLRTDDLMKKTENILTKIKSGAVQTAEIVKDLKVFTRLDEDALKKVNIHEGIDSTLSLLEHSLEGRINIIKKYGKIPPVGCYPGRLNQFLMSSISVAIDNIQDQGEIEITTALENNRLIIKIKDNGLAQKEENRAPLEGDSTGAGIPKSDYIINDHRGSVKVKREIGEGNETVAEILVIR